MKFKFKVGDRVRAKLEKEYMGVCNGDLGTITENSPCPFVSWDKLNGGTIALDEEELELAEYTYEDLKKSPIGTKITFEDKQIFTKVSKKCFRKDNYTRYLDQISGMKDNFGDFEKIIKVEEPTSYITVYESKSEILDEAEKRYLRGVIRPFRSKVLQIAKKYDNFTGLEYIRIIIKDDVSLEFPSFSKNIMYKNMEEDKEYTLEELGL